MIKDKADKTLNQETIERNTLSSRDYKYGFVTDIETDRIPEGLNEDVVCLISEKKKEPDWMRDWRLKAYRHWLKMEEPHWANFKYAPIDYNAISYYNAPKKAANKPKNLTEVDPALIKTFDKLGIPLTEQKRLSGVAVDPPKTGSASICVPQLS